MYIYIIVVLNLDLVVVKHDKSIGSPCFTLFHFTHFMLYRVYRKVLSYTISPHIYTSIKYNTDIKSNEMVKYCKIFSFLIYLVSGPDSKKSSAPQNLK